ncbi:MAG: aldehyde dehydrogenase family protein [Gemmatimonadota bacterium]
MNRVAEIFKTLEYGPAPESPATAVEWLEKHNRQLQLFINNDWVKPDKSEYFETINPATAKPLARIAQGSPANVATAVRAARDALPEWQALGGHGRARFLYALARLLQKHSRLFAVLETMDNGKPIRESRDIDIPLVARHFYHHAGWAQLLDQEFPGYEGVGVVGQIIPWNFPLLMLSWKIAPALAAGCTLVLKPAEFTSLTALLFAEICQEASLPPGVVNIVTGDGRTGEALVKHPDVDKIAFTGSTDVGRIIRVATAGSGKKISLELGGKSPFIVFEDADLDSVVEGVVDAIWFNQGQVCCAGSRILAQEGIAQALQRKLRARMETLRVGDPLDKGVDIGAIVAPVQLERIQQLVKQGEAEGAKLWQPSWSCPKDGYFFPPTLFTDVSPAAAIAQVEIFGPVVVMMTFRTPSEAVELANNTQYGLAGSIWTENINLALDIAPRVKAGTVWINCTNMFDAASGFGGYRESGFGREGGKEGMYEYLVPSWEKNAKKKQKQSGFEITFSRSVVVPTARDTVSRKVKGMPPIDRTAKLYIGGKQARPDQGYSLPISAADGTLLGEAARGNRKDIRNAVEAAHKTTWSAATAHNRAQVLFYIAENLSERSDEFASRIAELTGVRTRVASRQVQSSIDRVFTYAAWADKWDGNVHHTPFRNVTLAMPEALGVLAIVCSDDAPLLGFVSTVMPAIALGNSIVVVPSERFPLIATDLYQVFDTSDVPGGVINIVTGLRSELTDTLAAHDDVDGMWYFADDDGSATVERLAAGNMKRTWVSYGLARDWYNAEQGEGQEFLRHATQIKNIWVPYGE